VIWFAAQSCRAIGYRAAWRGVGRSRQSICPPLFSLEACVERTISRIVLAEI